MIIRQLLKNTLVYGSVNVIGLLLLFSVNFAIGQNLPITNGSASVSDSLIIKHIILSGHKKTEDAIILRELSILPGSKIKKQEIDSLLLVERNKVFNTNLFISTEITYQPLVKDSIDVTVHLLERWYFWPFPLFELADRNFNEWWNNRNRDLSRVNYGLYLTQKNFRGKNETIRARVQLGFTRRFDLLYYIPFLDKKQSWGMQNQFHYEENKVADYASVRNKGQDTSANEEIMSRRMFYQAEISKRIGYYDFHSLSLHFERNQVSSFISELNPDYFGKGKDSQRFFQLSYRFRRDRRNFQRYALQGNLIDFKITKIGLGIFNDINLLVVEPTVAKFRSLGNDFYWTGIASGKFSTPKIQPYRLNRAMGFGQLIIRGFDNYVVEGENIGVVKNELKWQAFNKVVKLDKLVPWRQFNTIPLELYPKIYFDMGYIQNSNQALLDKFENNRLTNRFLMGGGIGLDVVTFYSSVLRFEYSYNPIDKKTGFFFYYEIDL